MSVEPTSVLVPGPWTHRDVSTNGTRLHIAECGSGPLVLLVHGFPEFWWSWRDQLTALADAGYRAVACDLRGYGASDKPPRGYDIFTLASDLAGLIRALGERQAVLVGQDCGGFLAWSTAVLHPDVVRRLVVVGTPHPLRMRQAIFGELSPAAICSAFSCRGGPNASWYATTRPSSLIS
jgi:pimeloyl-ACP methyl ester carboxylesterase